MNITDKEYERYRGRHVAVVRRRVLCAGRSSKEGLEEAVRRKPELKTEKVGLYFIPAADELVL